MDALEQAAFSVVRDIFGEQRIIRFVTPAEAGVQFSI
jgi:hypothetical protein